MMHKENDLRFEFGENWKNYVKGLDDKKIATAVESVVSLLGTDSLAGKTFIDIGSGSGLFSLAAHILGAEVFSFDYDINSVEATQSVKEKYANTSLEWTVTQGSILDEKFITELGTFDYVYSWGVLHHTGDMYSALNNASKLVNDNGSLTVAIYNTQTFTPAWKLIKKFYVSSPRLVQVLMNIGYTFYFSSGLLIADLLRFRNPLKRYTNRTRGMNLYYDVVDWIGGYPFETATPEEIFSYYYKKGFELTKLITVAGKMGCNEFTFFKRSAKES